MVNRNIVLLIICTALAAFSPIHAQDPTPTCAPCVTAIYFGNIYVRDHVGNCTDNDNFADAGEIIAIEVNGTTHDQCCFMPPEWSVIVTPDNPALIHLGSELMTPPSSTTFRIYEYFFVSPDTICMDTVTVNIDGYASEGEDPWLQDEDHISRTFPLEADDDGGDLICDETDCQCRHTGDYNLNGEVTAEDAQSTFSVALGYETPSELEACAADCNGNGEITSGDAQGVFITALGTEDCTEPLGF